MILTSGLLTRDLAEWTDLDVAQYILAVDLGIIPSDQNFASDTKFVFWTDNPLGRHLYKLLEEFVAIGFLERVDEPDYRVRVSPTFRWEVAAEMDAAALQQRNAAKGTCE